MMSALFDWLGTPVPLPAFVYLGLALAGFYRLGRRDERKDQADGRR